MSEADRVTQILGEEYADPDDEFASAVRRHYVDLRELRDDFRTDPETVALPSSFVRELLTLLPTVDEIQGSRAGPRMLANDIRLRDLADEAQQALEDAVRAAGPSMTDLEFNRGMADALAGHAPSLLGGPYIDGWQKGWNKQGKTVGIRVVDDKASEPTPMNAAASEEFDFLLNVRDSLMFLMGTANPCLGEDHGMLHVSKRVLERVKKRMKAASGL